ncbi:plant intracellular Ras-group-related LRR 7-like [Micractinium conductrix]|uniref:Plant intracellular Ras-group-related LRR 7-like n=1 Tax=Micractinium conductrix TaxID=554055 RepID=A0A2P6VNB5_9CHLO|nr:plant intracellular Ras-group-related LRR 7-like [Micractinium conductrix]|eukprot:PSC75573.1 plant intracellular Ras-group-related LRR 7-like [Micractinium conductrix]
MGNCCGSPAAASDTQDVRRNKKARVANWQRTNVVGLRRAGLTALPSEVAEVTSARVLDASDNKLAALPPDLPPSLQRLVLSNNQLSDLAPLRHLTNLRVLVLDGNRIASLPPWIGELGKLETLSLSDNTLVQLPAGVGALTSLRQLLLSQNRLRALPPQLGACSALEKIDAHHNVLQALPPELGRLQRLKLLQLDSNQLEGVPPEVLRGCTSLATLSLHDNPIQPDTLHATDGWAEFEARRQGKYTKGLAGGALVNIDEGLDRPLAASPRSA